MPSRIVINLSSAEQARLREQMRRWKRAQLSAEDNDPARADKLARIPLAAETLRPRQALLFADEWDMARLPKSGYQGVPKGMPVEVLTPGQNEKPDPAAVGDGRTGRVHYRFGPRKTNQLFRDLLDTPELRYPARRYDRISVVVDNYKIHKAQTVEQRVAAHPRFKLLWLPTCCPRANPILER